MSTTLLIDDLNRIKTNENAKIIKSMILKAELYRYHDFKSSVDFPKLTLIKDLNELNNEDLKENVRCGKYDDEPEPDDETVQNVLREAFGLNK